MGIGNFGMWEMLVVGLIVLIFFGPRRLPEIARSAGKAMREFKRGMNEIQRELEIAELEEKKAKTPATTPTASSTPTASPATSTAPADAPPTTADSSATSSAAAAPDTTTPSIVPPIPTLAGAAAAAAAAGARPATGDSAAGRPAETGMYDGTQVDVGGEPTPVEAEGEPAEGVLAADELAERKQAGRAEGEGEAAAGESAAPEPEDSA